MYWNRQTTKVYGGKYHHPTLTYSKAKIQKKNWIKCRIVCRIVGLSVHFAAVILTCLGLGLATERTVLVGCMAFLSGSGCIRSSRRLRCTAGLSGPKTGETDRSRRSMNTVYTVITMATSNKCNDNNNNNKLMVELIVVLIASIIIVFYLKVVILWGHLAFLFLYITRSIFIQYKSPYVFEILHSKTVVDIYH